MDRIKSTKGNIDLQSYVHWEIKENLQILYHALDNMKSKKAAIVDRVSVLVLY